MDCFINRANRLKIKNGIIDAKIKKYIVLISKTCQKNRNEGNRYDK